MRPSSACRSVASGVVRTDSMRSSPIRVSTVPMSPVAPPVGPQRRLDEVGRRRLAVGAGDPEHRQVLGRVAVDRRPRRRRGRSRGSSATTTGTAAATSGAARARPAVVGEDRDGAGRHGIGDEVGAVHVEARAGRHTGRRGRTARLSSVTPVTNRSPAPGLCRCARASRSRIRAVRSRRSTPDVAGRRGGGDTSSQLTGHPASPAHC